MRLNTPEYKNISKALNIPPSKVKFILKQWKEYVPTLKVLSVWVRRTLVREATKRPRATLKDSRLPQLRWEKLCVLLMLILYNSSPVTLGKRPEIWARVCQKARGRLRPSGRSFYGLM